MSDSRTYEQAVTQLRRVLSQLEVSGRLSKVVEERDEVLTRFQPIFAAEYLLQLRQDEFHAFLLLENNHHWSGLQRHSPKMCADMDVLRDALAILIDEGQPVGSRIDRAVSAVTGMGKAVATAVLLVAFPDEYGVWNSTSEGGLKALSLWPRFEHGESLGSRYIKVNEILTRLVSDLQIDLWTLDILWWHIEGVLGDEEPEAPPVEGMPATIAGEPAFSLERHLQDFLWDNWKDTSLGDEWELYSEPGDPELGREYPCGIGRIDLLARHKSRPDWLVVELKRGQTSDATVGQVLRYMGWIRTNLAEPGEEVYGLVIAREADEGLRYALSTLPNVDMLLYEVEFQLHPVSQPEKERA
jgi:hypothetical protein